MDKILFLLYPTCDTCRKAGKWLTENNIDVEKRNISADKPTVAELTQWIEKSNLPVNRFFNTSGKIYREQNLKEKIKTASKEELIKLLASDGMLVKRPLLISGKYVLVGFNEQEWAEHLK